MLDEAMAWWYHAASFLYVTGLTLSLGAAAGPLILRRSMPAALRAASLLLVVGVMARLLAQVQMAFGDAGGFTPASIRSVVLDTPWGWGWRWQLATAALLAVQVLRRFRRNGARPLVPLALALAAAGTSALTGHAMAFPESAWLMVPVHAAHVAGAGLWMGSLAVLLTAVPRLTRDAAAGADPGRALAEAVSRFSTVALAAVGLVVVSGVAAATAHVASWPALIETAYGQALMLKVAAFLLAGLCGAWNWKRVSPRLATRGEAAAELRRVGSVELGLGVVVLLLTSLLAALPMPAELVAEEDAE